MQETTKRKADGDSAWEGSVFAQSVHLTREFVKVNSENPNHPEIEMQRCLEAHLRDMNFEFRSFPYKPGRNNVLAFYPSLAYIQENNLPCIMFSGHQDTVIGYEETGAKSAQIKDGRIYGRGACDMKGGIASFFTAINSFIADQGIGENKKKLKRGILISLTVDEEMGCAGIKALKDNPLLKGELKIDFCIIGEPSGLAPVIGHKGIVWFTLEFSGKAAHGSVPEQGDNAVEKAVEFISRLKGLKESLSSRSIPDMPEVTPPTLNVGVIKGGEKANIVPDRCIIKLDRRLIPTENTEIAKTEILKVVKACCLEDCCKIKHSNSGESYLIPEGTENPVFKQLMKIVGKYGVPACPFMEGYTEADVYHRYFGIPAINLGPGSIEQAHVSDEFVEIKQLLKASQIYYNILEHYVLGEEE